MISEKLLFLINSIFFSLGVILLFLYNLNQKPISSCELYKFIGDIVKVSGKIIERAMTKSNNTKYLVCDNCGCFYIVDLSKKSIECDKIYSKGKVEYFANNYYVFVFDKRDIKCLK